MAYANSIAACTSGKEHGHAIRCAAQVLQSSVPTAPCDHIGQFRLPTMNVRQVGLPFSRLVTISMHRAY